MVYRFSYPLMLGLVAACAPGPAGDDCVVEDGPNIGQHTVTCGAKSVVVSDGASGEGGQDGDDCSIEDGPQEGEHTVTCGEKTVVVRDGEEGPSGPTGPAGEDGDDCTVQAGPEPGTFIVTCGNDTVLLRDATACQVVTGDIVLQDALDVASIGDVCVINGSLTVTGTIVTLDLPVLEIIRGPLLVASNPALTTAVFGRLASVEGDTSFLNNPVLTATAFPALVNTGAGINFIGNLELLSVRLPSLTTVAGDFQFGFNSTLVELSTPLLADAGGNLTVSDTLLTVLEFPSLVTAAGFQVTNPALTAIGIPVLASIGGGGLSIVGNGSLSSFDAPALASAGNVAFGRNNAATVVSFPVLTDVVAAFDVSDNLSLTDIRAPQFTNGGSIRITDNPVLATCVGAQLTGIGDCSPN